MIEWTKGLYRKRQETYDAEIYQSGLPENKGISDSTKGNKGGNPNDMYSAFGQGYASTFKKMVGNQMKVRKHNDKGDTADAGKNPFATKRDVTDGQLKEMNITGANQFALEHKKHALTTYFIHKKGEIFDAKNERAMFTQE